MSSAFNLISLFVLFSLPILGQEHKPELYDPEADAAADLNSAIEQAKEEQKHVLVQVGGNWCPWCIRLHNFYTSDAEIDSIMNANYVTVRVNYSKKNKNPGVLKRLDFPQRFGFPVLVIINDEGERIHTQNTAYLEKDKSYDHKRLIEFLKQWSPEALRPENYE